MSRPGSLFGSGSWSHSSSGIGSISSSSGRRSAPDSRRPPGAHGERGPRLWAAAPPCPLPPGGLRTHKGGRLPRGLRYPGGVGGVGGVPFPLPSSSDGNLNGRAGRGPGTAGALSSAARTPSGGERRRVARGPWVPGCSPVRPRRGSQLPPLFSAGSIPPGGVDAALAAAAAAAAAGAAAAGCRGVCLPHCLESPPASGRAGRSRPLFLLPRAGGCREKVETFCWYPPLLSSTLSHPTQAFARDVPREDSPQPPPPATGPWK